MQYEQNAQQKQMTLSVQPLEPNALARILYLSFFFGRSWFE
jgi:hypothetical protein